MIKVLAIKIAITIDVDINFITSFTPLTKTPVEVMLLSTTEGRKSSESSSACSSDEATLAIELPLSHCFLVDASERYGL